MGGFLDDGMALRCPGPPRRPSSSTIVSKVKTGVEPNPPMAAHEFDHAMSEMFR